MKRFKQTLQECIAQQIKLSVHENRLKIETTNETVPEELLKQLKQHKHEIIAYLNEQAGLSKRSPIQKIARTGQYPLAFAQKRLWILDRLVPNNTSYNIPVAQRVVGPVNEQILEEALQQTVNDHEILRSYFLSTDEGVPYQKIAKAGGPHLIKIDWSNVPFFLQNDQVQFLIEKESKKSFNLAQPPLIKAFFIALKSAESIFFFVIHHIVIDHFSLSIFMDELWQNYQSLKSGKARHLPTNEIQYLDYAHWQNQWLQQEDFQNQLAFWKEKLERMPQSLSLPYDKPRPVLPSYSGASQPFEFSPQLSEDLREFCRESQVTLFMVLFSAYAVLLYRYSGQQQFLVGLPIENRNHMGLATMVGYLANTTVFPVDFSDIPSFRSLLEQIKKTSIEVASYQDVPLEKIVESLNPERDNHRNPLFQVIFNLQNKVSSENHANMGGLQLDLLPLEQKQSRFDLALEMEDDHTSIKGLFEYSTDLFSQKRIQFMVEHLQIALNTLLENPDHPIDTFPLLSTLEAQQLCRWNKTEVPFPQSEWVHDLFERQVHRTPQNVAISFEGQSLTYQQLHLASNRVAHYLRRQGVKPGQLVGLCLNRSLGIMVGILGVLKAGGAYVPMDPNHPKDRINTILKNSKASIIVTHCALASFFEDFPETVVYLDQEWDVIQQEPQTSLSLPLTGDSPAYVIYTSGSTGNPKGVQIPHRALVNLLYSMNQSPGFEENDIILSSATYSFDIIIPELFLPLVKGGSTYYVSYETASSGRRLAEHLTKSKATVFQATPTVWKMLKEAGWQGNGLKKWIGGEPLPRALATWLLSQPGELWHFYGPTEATVWATGCQLKNSDSLTVGTPFPNTEIHLLNKQQSPVPIGVPGEIYIGGQGLANGYHNQPDLTEEKFVTLSLDGQKEVRLYRTGDQARYTFDGNLVFLGRMDNQVKIRGFRVELGEIETVLNQHPSVKESHILLHGESEKAAIVAFIRLHQEESNDVLKQFLKKQLPSYMIPSFFVPMEHFPQTPNGKIDGLTLRQKIEQDQLFARDHFSQKFIAPRTQIEKNLSHLWEKTLGTQVGVHDNFFDLGGHSLLSVQLLEATNRHFNIAMSLQNFFALQTVECQAQLVGKLSQSKTSDSITFIPAPSAQQELVLGEVPFNSNQFWLLRRKEIGTFNSNIVLEFEASFLTNQQIQQAIDCLLRHHDALRLRFHQNKSGDWNQTLVHPDELHVFENQDLSSVPEAEQESVFHSQLESLKYGLDLSKASVRFTHFQFGAKKPSQLLIVLHHLTHDQYALNVLFTDFFKILQQIHTHQKIQLPPKSTSIQARAQAIIEYAQTDHLKKEMDYWLSLPWHNVQQIPVDYPKGRQNNRGDSFTVITQWLSLKETQTLYKINLREHACNTMDLLLTALAKAFMRWQKRPHFLMEVMRHQRDIQLDYASSMDVSRTVGWFVEAVPMVFQLDLEHNNLRQHIQTVKQLWNDIPNSGIGFGALRYLSKDPAIRKKMEALPLPEVCFSYRAPLDTSDVKEQLEGIQVNDKLSTDTRSPDSDRVSIIFCKADLNSQGQLELGLEYSHHIHRSSTIKKIMDLWIEELQKMICLLGSPQS